MARSLYRDAKTSRIAVRICSIPRTLRNVSCCPAKDASGRSSAVALDRTAKELSSSPDSSVYAARMSASRSAGNGWATTAALISCPTSARALHVVRIEVAESFIDPIGEPGVPDEAAIGVGGGRKAVRHADAELTQLGDHLAEAGVLPTDLLDVA